jgi:hypothetical protein
MVVHGYARLSTLSRFSRRCRDPSPRILPEQKGSILVCTTHLPPFQPTTFATGRPKCMVPGDSLKLGMEPVHVMNVHEPRATYSSFQL